MIATGISADGRSEVLGFDAGDSKAGPLWTAFLRSLRARGLSGTQLVTYYAHTGLKAAIESILPGASWQRCMQHFARNLTVSVPKGHADMVAAAVRTIFARRLYISPHTVNTHLQHVFANPDAPDRVALASVAHHSVK